MTTHPTLRWLAALWLLLTLAWPASAQTATPASEAAVLIIAVKGRVKIQRAGTANFINATTNLVLRLGDTLSTGDLSEATLRFADKSEGRVDELTDLEISRPVREGGRYEIEVREGGFYLLNRTKTTDQKFKTPVASGAILGTEFALRVARDGTTQVWLFEGAIELSNEFDSVRLAPHEQSLVQPGRGPVKSAFVDAVAPIQWTLYYPAILPPRLLANISPNLTEVVALYATGDLPAALAALDPTLTPTREADRLLLAQLALAAGQPDRARQRLGDVASPDAEALRALVETVQGRPPAEGPTGSPAALVSASYAAQARLDLTRALALAREAITADPEFGFGWVRVAELEFGQGHTAAARAALEQALRWVPRDAQAVALRGFVSAAAQRLDEARNWFEQAIALDPHLGNAWLGRGLCRIKAGDLAGGRADLQTAAALEPTRSLSRSYLGKAFAEERDPARARTELDRARELDPHDPTGWLYAALLDQQGNRLNDAVAKLEQSKALNDRRNLYRSRQLLDQDRAVRGANLAAVYRDAGLSDWGVREAGRAVQYDYANASAHLFLASAYDSVRDPRLFNLRYETPWFSELLLANLLAPVGAGPLSQNVSLQEYSRLLERDRLGLSSFTEYRGDGIWNERASQFGTFGGTSYALDLEYRHEAGYYPNTDLTHRTIYGKFKQQFGAADQLFVQVIYTDNENGDTAQRYDPSAVSPTYRFRERQEPNVFLGWHHEWSPGHHTLFLGGHLDDRIAYTAGAVPLPLVRRTRVNDAVIGLDLPDDPAGDTSRPPDFNLDYASEFSAWTAELQQIATVGRHTLVAGGRFQAGDSDTLTHQPPVSPNSFLLAGRLTNSTQAVNARLGRLSAYAYDTWQVLDPVRLTAGVAYERIESPENIDLTPIQSGGQRRDRVSPKLGVLWTVRTNTHLRAAWTGSLGGTFYDNSVRLEPVQVAGFTQAYRSLAPESLVGVVPGTGFETVSVGLDHQFRSRTYFGVVAEWLTSEGSQTFGAYDRSPNRTAILPTSVTRRLPYDERSVLVNVNQLLGQEWSVGLSYRWSEADLDYRYDAPYAGLTPSPERSYQAVLHQVNGLVQYAHPGGFYSQLIPRWNGQAVRGFTGQPGDDFWQFDLFVGYRFAQRRVDVRLGVLNLTDEDYRLQPLNVHEEYPRERMFYASLRLQF